VRYSWTMNEAFYQTGGEDGLYELKGLPPEEAQRIETAFMKPLDTLANDALVMLESDDPRIRLDPKYRSAWSRFLMSLMMRMPTDISVLREGLALIYLTEGSG